MRIQNVMSITTEAPDMEVDIVHMEVTVMATGVMAMTTNDQIVDTIMITTVRFRNGIHKLILNFQVCDIVSLYNKIIVVVKSYSVTIR